mgnify:CR=1 FL=1
MQMRTVGGRLECVFTKEEAREVAVAVRDYSAHRDSYASRDKYYALYMAIESCARLLGSNEVHGE